MINWIKSRQGGIALIPVTRLGDQTAAQSFGTSAHGQVDAAEALFEPLGVLVRNAAPLDDPNIARYYEQRDSINLTPVIAASRLGISPSSLAVLARLLTTASGSLCMIGHDADFIVSFKIAQPRLDNRHQVVE